MTYALNRYDKDGKPKTYKCTFHHTGNNHFNIYFAQTTEPIGLGDGNFHALSELKGITTKILINRECIILEDCFVEIGGKWHKDGFVLYFHQD